MIVQDRKLMEAMRDLEAAAGEQGFVAIIPCAEAGKHDVRTNLSPAVAYEMLRRAVGMMEDVHKVSPSEEPGAIVAPNNNALLADRQKQPGDHDDPEHDAD